MNKWTEDRFLKFNIYSIFSKSIHPLHPMWFCSNSLREYIILFYEWGSRQWIKGLSDGVTQLESGISGPQPWPPSALLGVNHPSADKPTGTGSWEPGTDWHLTRDLMSVFWESGLVLQVGSARLEMQQLPMLCGLWWVWPGSTNSASRAGCAVGGWQRASGLSQQWCCSAEPSWASASVFMGCFCQDAEAWRALIFTLANEPFAFLMLLHGWELIPVDAWFARPCANCSTWGPYSNAMEMGPVLFSVCRPGDSGFGIQKWYPCLAHEALPSLYCMNLPAVQETWVQSLGWKDSLEKGMATSSSIFIFIFFNVYCIFFFIYFY